MAYSEETGRGEGYSKREKQEKSYDEETGRGTGYSKPKKSYKSEVIDTDSGAFDKIIENDPGIKNYSAMNTVNTIVRSLTLASALISFILIFIVRCFPFNAWFTGAQGETANSYLSWMLNIAHIFNWITIGLVAAVVGLYIVALFLYIRHTHDVGRIEKIQSIVFKFVTLAAFGALLAVIIIWQLNGEWFHPYGKTPVEFEDNKDLIKSGIIFMTFLATLLLLLIAVDSRTIMLLFIILCLFGLVFTISITFSNGFGFIQDKAVLNACYGLGVSLPIAFAFILMYTSLNKLIAKNIDGLFKLLMGVGMLIFSLITYLMSIQNMGNEGNADQFIAGTTALISAGMTVVILVFKQTNKLY